MSRAAQILLIVAAAAIWTVAWCWWGLAQAREPRVYTTCSGQSGRLD